MSILRHNLQFYVFLRLGPNLDVMAQFWGQIRALRPQKHIESIVCTSDPTTFFVGLCSYTMFQKPKSNTSVVNTLCRGWKEKSTKSVGSKKREYKSVGVKKEYFDTKKSTVGNPIYKGFLGRWFQIWA